MGPVILKRLKEVGIGVLLAFVIMTPLIFILAR